MLKCIYKNKRKATFCQTFLFALFLDKVFKVWYTYKVKFYPIWRYILWKELRLSKPVIFAKALKTAVAVNARPLANLLAKQVAVLQISSAKISRINKKRNKLPPLKTAASFLNR